MSELKHVDESMIRAKAFELWLSRGAPIGSPENDWFSAKTLLESPPPPAVQEVSALEVSALEVSALKEWKVEAAVQEDKPAESEKPVPAVTSASRAPRRKQKRR